MLDRERVINWWIGRFTDAELADYAGMTTRNLQIVLNVPIVKSEVIGGGRGSKGIRRIPAKVRNSIAMVQALHDAGLTLELAAQVIGTSWYLPDAVNRAIDFDPIAAGVRALALTDPKGGFLPTDIVPAHIACRYVVPCGTTDNPNPTEGDTRYILAEEWNPDPTTGRMFIERPAPRGPLDLVPLTTGPVYQGEIDPLGLLLPGNKRAEAMPWDDHLEIINGRWIFHRSPNPSGFETMQRIVSGERGIGDTYNYSLIGEIIDGRKSVRSLWHDDSDKTALAGYEHKNFHSKLDVNLSLPVRRMKRRAFGLPSE